MDIRIQTVRVGNPSQAAGCESSDAEGNSVALAKFGFAIAEQLHERAVHVAEAEETEVVSADLGSPRPDVRGAATEGETPSGQPAGRRRYVAC
jgi:hypothetical protein